MALLADKWSFEARAMRSVAAGLHLVNSRFIPRSETPDAAGKYFLVSRVRNEADVHTHMLYLGRLHSHWRQKTILSERRNMA